VFGKFLVLGKAEGDCLEAVVVEQGAAKDALVGRLDLFRQVAEVRVRRGNGCSSACSPIGGFVAVMSAPSVQEDVW
jgi:hypothetical protein